MSDPTQPDLGALLQQAQALQSQLLEARDHVTAQVIEGQAGGGAVKVVVTGGMEFRSVHIDPTLSEDVSMIEDLLLAALHDAMSKIEKLNDEASGPLGSMFG